MGRKGHFKYFVVFLIFLLCLLFILLNSTHKNIERDNSDLVSLANEHQKEGEANIRRVIEGDSFGNNFELNICLPPNIETKIFFDEEFVGETTAEDDCVYFEETFVNELKIKTEWGDYVYDYDEMLDYNIGIDENSSIIKDFYEFQNMVDYLDKIIINDNELNEFASKLVYDCDSNDRVCEANKIYNFVSNKIKYRNDPRTIENIKSPIETLNSLSGDCEDQTILLNSLLENLGFKTYIVFTKNHAFSLVCLNDDEYNNFKKSQSGTITYYILDEKYCLIGEPTATNTYLGWVSDDYEDYEELKGFDSFTKKRVYLNS